MGPAVGRALQPEAEPRSRRLNLLLAEAVYRDLADLAKARQSSMTEVIRLALGLIKVVLDETNQGHKLIIAKADGTAVKELVMPSKVARD